ncbi:MAG: single-stranded-DNA-specific exonuclease RecJ [Pseudomonadota bacterium]|nr:single-stranded-DNA-specific exonuclease RecJ [Pseudomonadota bacterium]
MMTTDHVEPQPAFLGVERSLGGKKWRARLADDRAGLALAQTAGLPEIVARALAARGIDADSLDAFLEPTLRDALPDPSTLRDMDKAVARLVQAINGGERIGIFGDYDVDGATSTALLTRFFQVLGRSVTVYIPDRIKEGYGPNTAALLRLRNEENIDVVITVDCGITAHGPLGDAAAAGLDVIVVDHHVAEPRLPQAAAVVNPNRLDDDSNCGQLAAVGVTFLLVVALNRALRDAFWYGEGHAAPDLMAWLDLVALGTVCDVVPLTGVNRALVAQGLKIMARRNNPGIAALADVARIDSRPDAYHAGFVFGPRVNAGGRVGEAGLGARLLATGDAAEAAAIAARLDDYNTERRAIEASVLEAALSEGEAQADADAPVIIAASEGWHPGVIGIVAGRLRERFNRPACVVAIDGTLAKGSARSIPGVALGPAVIAAHQAGLLVNGGGHAMAAGFTIETGRLEEFQAFLNDHVTGQLGGAAPVAELGIDGALTPEGATVELIELLDKIGPFGAGNARPRFAFAGVRVVTSYIVGADHVRCFVTSMGGGKRLKSIAFRAAGTALGRALADPTGAPLNIAGHLQIDRWQGAENAQLIIEDAAIAE